jgi:predicted RNase H-like HicB family nuclease
MWSKAVNSAKGTYAMKKYNFAAVIQKDEDGYYAFCPELQGCYTSGSTYEEARTNLADAIRLHVEDRLASGEEIKPPESVNLTTVEVAV